MPDEKANEKEEEKRTEKAPQEKSWDEKWRHNPLGTVVWAGILIWIGVVLLVGNLGFYDLLNTGLEQLPGNIRLEAWPIALLGIGAILLIEAFIRLLAPEFRRPITGTLILALVFIGIGLGNILGTALIWPLILIALGIGVILRGLVRAR